MFISSNSSIGRRPLGGWVDSSPAELRMQVRKLAVEIAGGHGLLEDDFRFSRSSEALEARRKFCVVAREIQAPIMSDVEIAAFIGFPRVTMLSRIDQWRSDNLETSVEQESNSWFAEFKVNGKWNPSDRVRFASKEEAASYAQHKFDAWTSTEEWGIRSTSDKPTYSFENYEIAPLDPKAARIVQTVTSFNKRKEAAAEIDME